MKSFVVTLVLISLLSSSTQAYSKDISELTLKECLELVDSADELIDAQASKIVLLEQSKERLEKQIEEMDANQDSNWYYWILIGSLAGLATGAMLSR